jgi:hypothetical protein
LRDQSLHARALLTLFFTLLGFGVMGYHPGLEDDGVYLAAIKARLNPTLFPHNAAFFRLQMQATVFDGAMAGFVRATHMPLAWAELFWQFACLFTILFACHSIARRLFRQAQAQWAAVALVAAMFTLPVAGTALYLADQHLHPRNAAAALILLAVARVLAGRRWQAAICLAVAALVHPLMAAFGFSFCGFLTLALLDSVHARVLAFQSRVFSLGEGNRIAWRGKAAAVVPLAWVFESGNAAWHKALDTRVYAHLTQWTWYEWLGALAPILLFALLWRAAEKRGDKMPARFALAVFAYAAFQQILAVVLLAPSAWARLMPLQPMRGLQLTYFFLALVAGGLIGQYCVASGARSLTMARWAAFLLITNGTMLTVQLASFRGTPHIEMPGAKPTNPWLQAFAWIRANTPADAYFALDPAYLRAPGEDFHGFRALAERSSLADEVKDAGVAMQVPELAPIWARQVAAQQDWDHFMLADFERLKTSFGVDWVLVSRPPSPGLACAWHNRSLAVCRIP